ncbi:hypothetical protein ACHYQX_000008 [Campylobacter upsaliensis]
MAKSKRGFSFELRNSKQNTAFCVSKSGEAFSVFCFGVASQLIARGANATP